MPHYTPLHLLQAFRDVPPQRRTPMPVADSVFRGLVSLPLWRGMTADDRAPAPAEKQE